MEIYNKKGKQIGDDGKNDGKIHIVFDNKQAKAIANTSGNASLKGVKTVTLNGGKSTVDGVVASTASALNDTSSGAGDAGIHEEGGHTESAIYHDEASLKSGSEGETVVETVSWKPGPKRTSTNGGLINLFNGVSKPGKESLLDYWHVHTSGTVNNKRSVAGPSGTAVGARTGDIPAQRSMESQGYNATAIQVDTYGSDKVNFYNGSGVTGTMAFKNFKKLK